MSFWDRFRKKTSTTSEKDSGLYFKALESERVETSERTQEPSSSLMEQYELLYQRDAITFGCINYLTLRIAQDISFIGPTDDVQRSRSGVSNTSSNRSLKTWLEMFYCMGMHGLR